MVSNEFIERFFAGAPEAVFYVESDPGSRTSPIALSGKRPVVDFALKRFIPGWQLLIAVENFNTTAYNSCSMNDAFFSMFTRQTSQGKLDPKESDLFKPDMFTTDINSDNFIMSGTAGLKARCLLYRFADIPPVKEDVDAFYARLSLLGIANYIDVESSDVWRYLDAFFKVFTSDDLNPDKGLHFCIFDSLSCKSDSSYIDIPHENNPTFYSYIPFRYVLSSVDIQPESGLTMFDLMLSFKKYSAKPSFRLSQFV